MAALDVGVDIALRAPIAVVRRKSLCQTRRLMDLVTQHCGGDVFKPATPMVNAERGSQISFRHPQAYQVMQALIARGVIGDFRAPDIIRFGITPLYTRFTEIWDAAAALVDIMIKRTWQEPQFSIRQHVT